MGPELLSRFSNGTTPETAQIKSDRLTAQFDAIFESVTVGEAEQVIIEVDADFKPEGFLTTAEVTAQRADILTAQEGSLMLLKLKTVIITLLILKKNMNLFPIFSLL